MDACLLQCLIGLVCGEHSINLSYVSNYYVREQKPRQGQAASITPVPLTKAP